MGGRGYPCLVDCEFDHGRGPTLPVGETPGFVYAGDTTLGAGAPLPYGESTTARTLRCDSTKAAITCQDSTTRHGSSITRGRYQLF